MYLIEMRMEIFFKKYFILFFLDKNNILFKGSKYIIYIIILKFFCS